MSSAVATILNHEESHFHGFEVDALYNLTTNNHQPRRVTGEVMLHNYLLNKLNAPSIHSYEKVAGQWFDVLYDNQKVWAVYATSAVEAIEQRRCDLNNLKYTDDSKLKAKPVPFKLHSVS
jgi:hypothetical protein